MRFRLKSMRTACLAVAAALVLVVAAACSSSPSSSTSGKGGTTASAGPAANPTNSAPPVKSGGSLTVLEWTGFAGWPVGLDPATNLDGAADQDYMESIFGQLFDLGPNGKIIPDLATGYNITNGGKTITITLRQGVKFSDGTPFNSAAELWNFKRDLASACTCKPLWPVKSVTAPGPYTIQVTLTTPDGAFIDQMFDSIVLWPASETAFKKMGEKQFSITPVGAGPFTVTSDSLNNELVLKKNPLYWQASAGLPYLDSLTFKAVNGDEAGYQGLQTGSGQVYVGLSTPQLLQEALKNSSMVVDYEPGTTVYDLQLNTKIAPFNNPKAREAIYAATNFAPILKNVFSNLYPVAEGFTGPGGLCYQPTVPGYQQYNPTLAKQLIQQTGLDKVTINLGTIQNVVAQDTTLALQQEWREQGMHVTVAQYPLTSLISQFTSGKWQSMIQTAGAWDPAGGVGVAFRFESTSPFSGVHDPHMDSLLNQAEAAQSMSARCSLYDQAAKYIAQNYYGPFYFVPTPTDITAKGVGGPGLTEPMPGVAVGPTILWQQVWYNP